MSFKKTKNADIRLSKKDALSKEEFDPKNIKERITIFIDQDILDKFRQHAAETGKKYQTLINEALRDSTLRPSLEERVIHLEEKIKKLA